MLRDMASAPLPQAQLNRRTSGEAAALYIRKLIFDGYLRPGARVHQDDVAQALGISRIPVREALIALEQQGWVTIEPNRGAFVDAARRAGGARSLRALRPRVRLRREEGPRTVGRGARREARPARRRLRRRGRSRRGAAHRAWRFMPRSSTRPARRASTFWFVRCPHWFPATSTNWCRTRWSSSVPVSRRSPTRVGAATANGPPTSTPR